MVIEPTEPRTALVVVRISYEGLQASRAAAASTAATLADKAYRGGPTTNIEVVDAERQARNAESQVALAEDAAREARLDLLSRRAHPPSASVHEPSDRR